MMDVDDVATRAQGVIKMDPHPASTSRAGARKPSEYKMTYDHLIALTSFYHQPTLSTT